VSWQSRQDDYLLKLLITFLLTHSVLKGHLLKFQYCHIFSVRSWFFFLSFYLPLCGDFFITIEPYVCTIVITHAIYSINIVYTNVTLTSFYLKLMTSKGLKTIAR